MVDIIKEMEEKGGAFKPDIGKIIAVPPLGQDTEFNFSLPMGKGTELWISFVINLEKKGYTVKKLGEDLEVSPVDAGYYNITQKQKEEMEARIKQGLASVSSAVSDYELISHDVRKYKEFLKMIETNDEHSLRAVFIDEVDVHAGANGMKGMVARWPTIIADFMTLGEKIPKEIDVNKIKSDLHISKAEAVILSTKQRLFLNWKEMFGSEVRDRVSRLVAQQDSRRRSIEDYKNWLKPLIARHRLHKEGFSDLGAAKEALITPYHSPSQAISTNNVTIWAWQPIVGIEPKIGTVDIEKKRYAIDPCDEYIAENFIFNEKHGLEKDYPWLKRSTKSEKWVEDNVKAIKDDGWMKDDRLYYVFIEVNYNRNVIKLPGGGEFEDITFKTKNWFLSQNALLVALLKLKAEQEKFDREVNQLIGVSGESGLSAEDELKGIISKWKEDEKKRKEKSSSSEEMEKQKEEFKKQMKKAKEVSSNILKTLGMDRFSFSRNGPYEHDFEDRITNIYLVHTAKDFYGPHVAEFLSRLAGVGK